LIGRLAISAENGRIVTSFNPAGSTERRSGNDPPALDEVLARL